jgi:hypothetical protein
MQCARATTATAGELGDRRPLDDKSVAGEHREQAIAPWPTRTVPRSPSAG